MKALGKKGISLIHPAILALLVSFLLASCSMSAPTITAPRYALVYGIKDYPLAPTGSALKYTVADANSISSILSSQGWTIREYTDSIVTKAKIKADIIALSSISPDSTILVYYSGHGTLVDAAWGSNYFPSYSGAYICPYDSVESSVTSQSYGYIDTLTIANLISPSELQSWLSQTGTKNVVLILDCCYSGGFVSSSSAADASPQNYSSMQSYSAFSTAIAGFGKLLVSNASASGAKAPIVLSGAGSQESDYDGSADMAHGVFTYYLLQAATKGDSDGDGVVTTTEAYAYTAKSIKEWDATLTSTDTANGTYPFLPHISGDTRDLVLFSN